MEELYNTGFLCEYKNKEDETQYRKEFLQALSHSYPRPLPQLWKTLPIEHFNNVEGMESFFP